MAGVILILMGATGLGIAVKFIPRPVTIGFTNGKNTGAKITELLDDQAASIQSVVQEMERGFIEASGMRMPIKVIVSDCRRYSREPLPQIGSLREVVIP
jgi:hypothetical protein